MIVFFYCYYICVISAKSFHYTVAFLHGFSYKPKPLHCHLIVYVSFVLGSIIVSSHNRHADKYKELVNMRHRARIL